MKTNETYQGSPPNTPAFPTGDTRAPYAGMNLRDYFAAKALQGMIASEVSGDGQCQPAKEGESFKLTNARLAYAWADAMLRARCE